MTAMGFLIRTETDPRKLLQAVESQIYALDGDQPLFDILTMEERLSAALATQRFHLILIGTFASIAILLASLGVYGVMSYLVARRTRELGIRIAMGARPQQVRKLVVGETLALAVGGAIVGLAGAWGLTRYLERMLYGVEPSDAATFIAMPLVLILVALAASFAPALRASRVDPITALRCE
jgi:ABC-type antimicrobial peptide transport system permease subunit